MDGAVCAACWAAVAVRPSRFALRDISHAEAVGVYDHVLRDILHAFKYDGRRSIAPQLSALLASHCASALAGADLVVPVPLHRRRHRERGFNQSTDLARHLGPPVVEALDRVKATRPQVELPAAARRDNMREAFVIRRPIRRQIVVLVDDVTTTGATLEACARVLKTAGAADVRAVTVARVVTGPH